jgi:hypothetical protein
MTHSTIAVTEIKSPECKREEIIKSGKAKEKQRYT